MSGRVAGKVAIIVGGGQTPGETIGNGRATALLLAQEGARVFVADRDLESAEDTADLIRKAGGEATACLVDVVEEEQVEAMVGACIATYGAIDILHNNVGASLALGDALATELSVEAFDRIIAVNLRGMWLASKHALPQMRKQEGGSIINISSIYGIAGSPQSAPYHASKGAVRTLSKSAAIQFAPDNIRVNSIHPGFVDTAMTEFIHDDPKIAKWRLDQTPLRRFGQPRDIAMGCLYLASDEAEWVTGTELVIDGGYLAQ